MKKINLIKVSATFILMMSFYNAFSQGNLAYKKNQFNNKGQKEGFWVEKSTYWIRERYFKNGMLSGIYKEFNSDGKLLLQCRSAEKITFPLYWANTCCSHPLDITGETDIENDIGVKR